MASLSSLIVIDVACLRSAYKLFGAILSPVLFVPSEFVIPFVSVPIIPLGVVFELITCQLNAVVGVVSCCFPVVTGAKSPNGSFIGCPFCGAGNALVK